MFESCLRNYPARLDVWSQYLDQVSSLPIQRLRPLELMEIRCNFPHSFVFCAKKLPKATQVAGSDGTKCCTLAHVKHKLWHAYVACKELKPKVG